MLCPHTFATPVCSLDLDFVLATHRLNLLILPLHVFELHGLHLDDHGTPVDSPLVKGLLELRTEQFD